jgi:hypothetical protein
MALTTKFINTPVTVNFSTSISSQGNVMIGSDITPVQSATSISENVLASSALSSVIYTVPAGRTAKVYITPIIILNQVVSVSISTLQAIFNGGIAQNTGTATHSTQLGVIASVSLYFSTGINFLQYSISRSLVNISWSEVSTISTYPSSLSGSYVLSSNFAGSSSIASSFYEGGYAYFYMGPGDSIYYTLSASLLYSKFLSMSRVSRLASLVVNDSGTISANCNIYSYFMVIEESGS